MRSQRKRGFVSRGFTLLEVLATVAMIAIVLALGMPSFEQAMRSNRVAVTTNALIASLALARGNAIRADRGGNFCASLTGVACSGSLNDGWLVWNDVDRDELFGSGDEAMRYVQPERVLVEVVPKLPAVAFDLRGRIDDGVPRKYSLRPVECTPGAQQAREITLSASGQIRMERKPCP